MIRALIFLVVMGVVLTVSYISSNYIIKPTAKILVKEVNQTISPLEYTITSIPGNKVTRIAILFEDKPEIKSSCIDSVKIDNESIDFEVNEIDDRGIEIILHKRLVGAHKIFIRACGKVINDVLIIR